MQARALTLAGIALFNLQPTASCSVSWNEASINNAKSPKTNYLHLHVARCFEIASPCCEFSGIECRVLACAHRDLIRQMI